HPERHFPCVHVAGTNGRGSTCAFTAAALAARGFRVGVYTSPHLVSVRERVVVDGVPISEDAFAEWASVLEPHIERLGASFFEATTAIALDRKSTRLNSSHLGISYAVFCLKKKKKKKYT